MPTTAYERRPRFSPERLVGPRGGAARLSRLDKLPFSDFASANHTHGSLPQLSWRGKRNEQQSRSWPPHRHRLCPWTTLSRAKAQHASRAPVLPCQYYAKELGQRPRRPTHNSCTGYARWCVISVRVSVLGGSIRCVPLMRRRKTRARESQSIRCARRSLSNVFSSGVPRTAGGWRQ